MKCPDCQEDLTQVPTSHGPGLDVCSSGHGLWLDVGEVNFFVEDYTSLKRALGDTGGVAVKTETLCPRCGIHLESATVSYILLELRFLSRVVAASRKPHSSE
ncbi:MAG: zf-TFIIB domain-containing protein [Nitrospiraceae bacterium]|nr:zf-TFIIB domain-containing protein [Nitrospiraceae bacterium]